EFKQIIGRGTRLDPEHGKEYFTIMDFRNASRLFADPAFDGIPEAVTDVPPGGEVEEPGTEGNPPTKGGRGTGVGGDNDTDDILSDDDKVKKYRVNDVNVRILNERVQYYDKNGQLVTEKLKTYTKKNILKEYATLGQFLKKWKSEDKKETITQELAENGVLLDALREEHDHLKDLDEIGRAHV